MPLTRSITSLITDGCGLATNEFLTMSPDQWATQHMAQRYGHTRHDYDPPQHFASLCYAYLVEEHAILRNWFQDNKLSSLLQSKFLQTQPQLGDGIGWDFKPNGDPELLMIQFKTQLISAYRSLESIPLPDRNSGSPAFSGIRMMVRSAYESRARLHAWRPQTGVSIAGEKVMIPGSDMSRRWVAYQTLVFLIKAGLEPSWVWEASKCRGVFGPADEERVPLIEAEK